MPSGRSDGWIALWTYNAPVKGAFPGRSASRHQRRLSRFRWREILVCYGAGIVETGASEYCFLAELRLAGGRSINDGIVRIGVSEDADDE